MIGLDTNIVLRLLLNDDPAQTARVRSLLKGSDQRTILNDLVLAETAWNLRRHAKQTAPEVLKTMMALIRNGQFSPPDGRVETALFEAKEHSFGFADGLIGARNAAAGCETTYTFDKRAARSGLFTLVPE